MHGIVNLILYFQWFLDSVQKMGDKGAIADLFAVVNDPCIQYLQVKLPCTVMTNIYF